MRKNGRSLYVRSLCSSSSSSSSTAAVAPRSSPDPSAGGRRRDQSLLLLLFRCNSAITACFRAGDVDRARQIFNQMTSKNVVTWNCMLSGYAQNRRIAEAQQVFDQMPTRDVVSWAALLTGYARCGHIDRARRLFDRIPQQRRNVVCWNSMISAYINNGMLRNAQQLFDQMPTRNTASWSIIISGYLHNKHLTQARLLFDRSPSRHARTSLCNALLSGYAQLGPCCLEEARDLFAKMSHRDVVSWNAMITCYSRSGQMELARRLFEEMPDKDIISWTAIIRGFLQNGDIVTARRLFDEMPARDVMAWNTMMGGYVRNGMLEDALDLFNEMPPERDIVSWNTILQGYVQRDDMVGARTWFEKMPQTSETSWNTLMSGYRNEDALVLFCKMVQQGFRPDQGTFAVVISVCASLVALGLGRMVHLHALRAGYEHDTLVMSSLIAMYSRCGLISDATLVFECLSKRDTIAWNAMIAAQAYHGFATKAFRLLDEMILCGFSPDHATFLSILLACAHKGLVGEGFRYFVSMQEDWKLVPRPEHYSCVVDLLGRSGYVGQAYDFTTKIPTGLQSNAWETLLSACRVHGNLEIGELTAQKVLQAKPFDGGMHILLSNIYAEKGLWKSAASTRASMRERGVKKETGCSWIEVKGKMSSFVSNDKSHPLLEEVHKELDNLSIVMEAIT